MSAQRRSAGLERGVSRDRRKVSGKAAAGGPGTAKDRSGHLPFRAARIASRSHRLSLATKRPRGSGEAGPAGPWPAAARGQRNHPASSNTKAYGLVPQGAGGKKETPPRGEPGGAS